MSALPGSSRATLALPVVAAFVLTLAGAAWGASRILYETRFEASEGFSDSLTLVGQQGWVGVGTGGNGLVSDFFSGEGQHAFLGFEAPPTNETAVSVWRPVGFQPGPSDPTLVRFTVLMSIEDSVTTTNRDDFRWTVYNHQEFRLFGLDFDNDSLAVHYYLDDDAGFVPTGRSFTNSIPYALAVTIDLARNRWSATLDGSLLVTNVAVTTRDRALTLGDIDAEWVIRTPGKPGDNYLVFDNYRIVAESETPPAPPRLQPLGLLRPGEFLIRCLGTPQTVYRLEATPDLTAWIPIKTNTMPVDGFFDHLDQRGGSLQFYRLVEH